MDAATPLDRALEDLPLGAFDADTEIRVETLTTGHGMAELDGSAACGSSCCCSC